MRYTKILVPLDGSQTAEQILPYARLLARALEVPVQLVRALEVEELAALASRAQGRLLDSVVAESMQEGREYLEKLAGSFPGADVGCSVEMGKPEHVIIDKAAADKGTLIAMSTHGRSGFQRWLLGSVAEKVLRGASNHLLLVRASEGGKVDGEASLTTVVTPLDGSALAERALPYVLDLAKAMKLEVILMRAYAMTRSLAVQDFGPNLREFIAELEVEAKNYLEAKAEELKRNGVEKVSTVVDFGYGATEIIALGRKTPDNLIAMSSHGRSGIQRWVLGSVAEKVVRHSGDPVLVIRAQA